jgi:hypothetical protein
MSPEKTEKLIKNFPTLYGLSEAPPTEALMCFGFECDDGWIGLIWALSEKIERWNDKHPKTPIRAVQVKEKFGGLRFYVDHEPDEIHEAIQKAEKISYKTCEMTGVLGRLCRRGSWYKTLCAKEAKKLDFVPVSEAE